MITAEEVEDRCQLCGTSVEFHIKNPSGVRFAVPIPMLYRFDEPLDPSSEVNYDIMICDGFVTYTGNKMTRNQMMMYVNTSLT